MLFETRMPMKRKLIAAVLVLLVVGSSADALNGPRRALLFGGKRSQPVVPNIMSLDGSNSNVNPGTSSLSTDITTTKTDNVIVAMVLVNGGPLTGVSGSTLGAFTKRASAGTGANLIEEWYVISPVVLTNEVVTAVATSSGYMTVIVFAVNGAKTSAPFDTNASLPNLGTTDPRTVSTTGSNTMIIGGLRGSTDMPTPGAGYTGIENDLTGAFMLVEYKLVSSAQTNLSVTVGTGAGTTNGAIGDALVQGP